MNPVHAAVRTDDAVSLMDLLRQYSTFPLDNDIKVMLVCNICYYSSISCLEAVFLHAGASGNMYIPFSEKPLLSHAICGNNTHTDMVCLILKYGADVNCADKYGLTPLCYAVMCSQAHLIPILLSHGADIELNSPLTVACGCNFECVRLLVEAGARLPETCLDEWDTEIVTYVFETIPFRISRCRAAVDATCLCLRKLSYFVDKPVAKKIAGFIWAGRRQKLWE